MKTPCRRCGEPIAPADTRTVDDAPTPEWPSGNDRRCPAGGGEHTPGAHPHSPRIALSGSDTSRLYGTLTVNGATYDFVGQRDADGIPQVQLRLGGVPMDDTSWAMRQFEEVLADTTCRYLAR